MNRERQVWFAFFLLSFAWGTSYLFIKIGVEALQPLTLVSARLSVGLVGLCTVLAIRRQPLPRDLVTWRHVSFMGVINTAIPFFLITWAESGENGIDSSLAAVLNSTVPLFSILIAGIYLRTETLSSSNIGGVILGFVGVVILVGQDLNNEIGKILPQLAVVGASLCYAVSGNYGRANLRKVDPVVSATGQLLVAFLIVSVMALIFEGLGDLQLNLQTVGAVLWLGLVGSCLAYILYYLILRNWGATRTTLVTYVIPVVGVTAGVIFLDEPLTIQLIIGGLLILSGIALVNWKPSRKINMKTDNHRAA